jgi:ABC-type maltose transport system permease subunit
MSNLDQFSTTTEPKEEDKAPTGSLTRERRIQLVLRLLVAVIAVAFALFPIVWIISASFNPTGSLASQRLIP